MPSDSPSADSRPRAAAPSDPVVRSVPAWAVLAVLGLGVAVRLIALGEPTAVYSPAPWREADYLQIARNFLVEDGNPFVPRIDWRGATSGAAEMEFPLLPWLASLVFRVSGVHALVLRVLAAACSLGALFVFRRLASQLLGPRAALAALLLFAVSPFPLTLASAMQPEPLLLLFSLLAASSIVAWDRDADNTRALVRAGLWTAAAILAKASAAHLGLLLAFLVLRRHGALGWLRRREVLVAAIVALLPPLAWYGWAHATFLETGLSLGLSNETHGLSAALLAAPGAAVMGNVSVEARDVFAHAGLLLALAALPTVRGRALVPAAWYAAVLVFYGLSLDTSGDGWAAYYHVLSAAPAVLLMGAGAETLLRRRGAVLWLGVALVIATAGLSSVRSLRMTLNRRHQPALVAFRAACVELAPAIPRDALVAVRGGERLDPHGHPVAFNASMAFAWLDRRGDNYAIEDASPDALRRLAAAGCTHWLVLPADRADPDVAEFAARLRVVAESGDYSVVLLENLP